MFEKRRAAVRFLQKVPPPHCRIDPAYPPEYRRFPRELFDRPNSRNVLHFGAFGDRDLELSDVLSARRPKSTHDLGDC